MNILMIGSDDSTLSDNSDAGNTLERLRNYTSVLNEVEPGSNLHVLVHSRRPNRVREYQHLTIRSVKVSRVQFFPLAGLFALFRLQKLLQPEVITVQSPFESGLLGFWAKRMFNLSLEVQVHLNLLSPHWLNEHHIFNRIRLMNGRYILSKADAIRVVSTPVRLGLIDRWNIPESRIQVIPVPAFFDPDQEIQTLTDIEDSGAKIILFVGRLCAAKNLPMLFQVLHQNLKKDPQVQAVLIGDGPLREYAEEQAKRIDSARIHLLGRVPFHILPAWYKRASLVVLPSWHEGFARVLQESYLMSTPVVATRCGGPEDIILESETGFLTDPGDIQRFSERVEWLLEHRFQAEKMGQLGKIYVQNKFNPDVLVHQMVNSWAGLKSRKE